MAEPVDARDLKSLEQFARVGSSPTSVHTHHRVLEVAVYGHCSSIDVQQSEEPLVMCFSVVFYLGYLLVKPNASCLELM